MKFRDQTKAADYRRTIELPRPDGSRWAFQVQPLPLGFHRRLRERGIAPPTAPTRIARDSAGKPIRDESGMAVTTLDTSAPEYLDQLELYHQRVAVLAVAEALRADPDVSFETPQPGHNGSWAGYADALYREMELAGFAAGDLIRLCDEICRLSNLLSDDLRRAEANFSSRGAAGTT